MTSTKSKYSVAEATKVDSKTGKISKKYLSRRDEELGVDINLDMKGWSIKAL